MFWVRRMRIEDPLLCPSAVQGMETNVFPTKRGHLDLTIEQIGLDRLWMSRYEVNLPQISRFAVRPGRRSISFLPQLEGPSIQHCGMEVAPGDIVIDKLDVLQHQRTGANHRYCGMSLPDPAAHFVSLRGGGKVIFDTLLKKSHRPLWGTFVILPKLFAKI